MATHSQLLSLAYIPKITGGLSMIGSSIICYDVLKDRKTKLTKVYSRLLLAMSFGDFFLSFTFFLSTWPTPKDAPTIWSAGNTATCTAQGFFQQFFVTSIFYNAWLAIYYVMVIVWGWNDAQIVPYERFAHAFSLTFSITTATIALVRGLYDTNFVVWCFISDWKESLILNIGWQWLCFFIVLGCMLYLWCSIRKQFKTTKKYGESMIRKSQLQESALKMRSSKLNNNSTAMESSVVVGNMEAGNSNNDADAAAAAVAAAAAAEKKKAKKRREKSPMSLITVQAALYAGAYFLTESSNIIICIAYYMKPVGEVPIEIIQYGVIVLPLQGFWNCLIYFRPRYIAYKDEQARKKERAKKNSSSNNTKSTNTTNASLVHGSDLAMVEGTSKRLDIDKATNEEMIAQAGKSAMEEEEKVEEE